MKVTQENYIQLMQQGNEKALHFFIEKDGWIVKSMVKKYLAQDKSAQEECMNDIFLAVWNHIDSYRSQEAAFTTWLAGVSRYHIMNTARKRKRWNMAEILKETEELSNIDKTGNEDVQTNLFVQAEKEEFMSYLTGLNEIDRRIFIKIFWEEADREEVCEEMKMSKEVLYNHISRGKKKIRKAMEEKEGRMI